MESAWTPDKITALFAGLGVVITALGGVMVLAYQIYLKTKSMQVKTQEVHDAVNGANSALLLRVDRLTSRVADLTGKPHDEVESVAAHAEVLAKSVLPISAISSELKGDK